MRGVGFGDEGMYVRIRDREKFLERDSKSPGFGFQVESFGASVWGLKFRGECFGDWAWCSGFKRKVLGSGFRNWCLRVIGVHGLRIRVQG